MLIRSGVPFETKPFAIGTRAEHPQEIINRSQWGRPFLPGITSAEYKLTFNRKRFIARVFLLHVPGRKSGSGNAL